MMSKSEMGRAVGLSMVLGAIAGGAHLIACEDSNSGAGTTPTPTGTMTTSPTTSPTPTTPIAPPDAGPPVSDGGDASPVVATTCKEYLAANPGAPSGTYTLDLDGVGTAYPPLPLYCDMTFDGGGWTLIQSYTGADSPANFVGSSPDAGVLEAAPAPGKLGALAGWIVSELAKKSAQVHIRLSFASAAGADAGTWVSSKVPDAGQDTRVISNLRELSILTKGTDGGFEEWSGPQATADRLAWFPLYGGSPATCGAPVEAQKYPSIYWACGNFTSMNILQVQPLCRWQYSASTQNEPMEVYVR